VRVILLNDLAVICRRNQATLTVRHAVSNGTYRTKPALNVADIALILTLKMETRHSIEGPFDGLKSHGLDFLALFAFFWRNNPL